MTLRQALNRNDKVNKCVGIKMCRNPKRNELQIKKRLINTKLLIERITNGMTKC